MATFNVSGASQLASAIVSARGGDMIRLAAGTYGTLNLSKKFSGNVTITSASDSNKATFTTVKANGAANVTFDGIKFDSRGVKPRSGTGSARDSTQLLGRDRAEFRLLRLPVRAASRGSTTSTSAATTCAR